MKGESTHDHHGCDRGLGQTIPLTVLGDSFVPGNLTAVFEALVGNTADCVQIIDLDGRVVRWNSACEELYGWAGHQILGERLPHVEAGQRPRVLQDIRNIAASGCVTERDMRVVRADGSRILTRTVAIPFTDDEGDSAGVVLLTREIGSDSRLNRQREEFAGAVSRQTKDPMTAILGFTQLLQRHEILADPSRRQRTVKALAEKTWQMSAVLDGLQLTFESEYDDMTLSVEPLDLCGLVTSAVERVSRPGTQVLVDFDPSLSSVEGDARRLTQAILCLIDNAARHSPEGGCVGVSVYASKGEAVIEVADAGQGIDPLVQERIFERFYSVPAHADHQPGLGIGLSLVRAIAQAHGGSVNVDSVPGAGSTFTMRLPSPTAEKGPS